MISSDEISGKVYAATYEGETLDKVFIYDATKNIPVNVKCEEGQTIKFFWWNSNQQPYSDRVELPVK